MKSIRLFLTISIISTIILANFLAALHGYQESMQEAEVLFDRKLEDYSDFLAISSPTQINQHVQINQHAIPEISPQEKSQFVSAAFQSAVIFQVRDENNNVLFQSNVFDVKKGEEQFDFKLAVEKSYLNYANFRWRKITRFYQQDQRWVLVMEKQDVRYKLAESVILKSVYPIILAVPTIALIIFFIVRQGLKPVSLLASRVDNKQAGNLSPIEMENVPEELNRLTERINDLLFRLNSSLSREKRFASDAAHELRTPIAALNIQMKNLIDEGINDEGLNDKESIAELSHGVKRMSHLVEQILMLNRSSPELYADQFQSVDLSRLLKNLIAELYPLIDERGHEIELEHPQQDDEQNLVDSDLIYNVPGEEFALQTLFKNLIINAIKYTPVNGQIRVKLEQNEQSVMVAIMDSGPGIAKVDRRRIFERFYRLDGDRNQSKVIGCGLGLAIVKQIADLHHAKIQVSDSSFKIDNGQKMTSGLCVKIIFQKQH